LGVAVDYAKNIGIEAIKARAWYLADYLREALSEIPGAKLRDIGSEQCAIVSFTIEGMDPRNAVSKLRSKNIAIGASDPSSTRLDAEARNLPTVLRAAPHYYNTTEEIDQLIYALAHIE
ncbi:MAG: aminotransferase class V-fold PLP-dependent enzyme, partial [Gammaproteobacteria bacterium]|nr:aminotransferase class V-fold PLP-dependent enzyme [Gammaproteobacteria bacterium]